jgi:cell division protein FtsI (penicillin-binding protein 3)
MLENVVTKGALTKVVQIPGYRSALKTGTAEQSNGDGTYGGSFIVSNAGLIPAEDPKYVVYVVIAYPDGDTFMACPPVFRDVMAQVIKEYRIQPSTSASPDLAVRF